MIMSDRMDLWRDFTIGFIMPSLVMPIKADG